MSVEFNDLNDKLRYVILNGRLDIEGTEKISMRFKELIEDSNRNVIIDLSAVSFLASMGIRELITNAKEIQKSGRRMILFVGQNQLIAKILETTNINKLLPMYKEAEEAKKAATD